MNTTHDTISYDTLTDAELSEARGGINQHGGLQAIERQINEHLANNPPQVKPDPRTNSFTRAQFENLRIQLPTG